MVIMFNFFNNKKAKCPLTEENRLWVENSILWLMKILGEDIILNKPTILPTQEFFPFKLDKGKETTYEIIMVVEKQFGIPPELIELHFYKNNILELKNDITGSLMAQSSPENNYPSGLFFPDKTNGKYTIALDYELIGDSTKLIAVIAHELSHLKLIGEKQLTNTDEPLTDLTTVFYGLGIFNANASFIFYQDSEKWGYNKIGYLTQQEWGYALAIYSYIRRELKPHWVKYLSPNLQSDFIQSEQFIYENTDKVLV